MLEFQSPPTVDTFLDDQMKSRASEFQPNKATEQKQLWLKHMDAFAEYLFRIPDNVQDAIRVAVIDDGFDGFQEDYTDNVVSGVSFCRYSDTNSLMNAYYVPSGRHGTIMASLICRVCPLAKLYVARLDEYKISGGKRRITAQSAADAVRWAITKGVHIISMSWTIESSSTAPDIEDFRKAIKDAAAKNIILLCAFSDQGNVSSTSCFPGAFDETMTIGAATSLGHPCTWVDKSQVDLLFPGEHIIVEQKPGPSSRAESGSSLATALAAGMVALLLHLTQLVKPDLYEQFRKDMKAKLLKQVGSGQYFNVKELFRLDFNKNQDWEWNSSGKDKVNNLIGKFID